MYCQSDPTLCCSRPVKYSEWDVWHQQSAQPQEQVQEQVQEQEQVQVRVPLRKDNDKDKEYGTTFWQLEINCSFSIYNIIDTITLICYLTIATSMYLGSVGSPPTPVPMESQWIRNAIHMTANSIGLSVAYFMQKTAVTFGGCTMGSEYLLITFEDLVDPLLSKLSLPTLKR